MESFLERTKDADLEQLLEGDFRNFEFSDHVDRTFVLHIVEVGLQEGHRPFELLGKGSFHILAVQIPRPGHVRPGERDSLHGAGRKFPLRNRAEKQKTTDRRATARSQNAEVAQQRRTIHAKRARLFTVDGTEERIDEAVVQIRRRRVRQFRFVRTAKTGLLEQRKDFKIVRRAALVGALLDPNVSAGILVGLEWPFWNADGKNLPLFRLKSLRLDADGRNDAL